MKRFKNILVGVDLTSGDQYVSDELTPPTEEAVKRAIWLAEMNSANLHFYFTLDVCARTQRLIEESQSLDYSVFDHAKDVLARLVLQAQSQGVSATSNVTFGKSWLEIIRQVLRKDHDLAIVGTRHMGRVKGMLIGSTGMKLLRKCPCPVWITQPQPHTQVASVLVATDFSPVCDDALTLGASMAELNNSDLHIVHALEMPTEASLRRHNLTDERIQNYRQEVEANARQALNDQLARTGAATQVARPHIDVKEGHPGDVIKELTERLKIELLVMGTVARTGVPGILMGNTAERLLPQVSCSVLAVKPKDFLSPVTLD